jgi:hypothetical protein
VNRPGGTSALNPQDVGVGVFAGQRGRWRRVREQPTCGLFTSVQDVWSPTASVMGPRCAVCDGRSDGTGRQEGCGVCEAVDAVLGYSTDRRMVSMRMSMRW